MAAVRSGAGRGASSTRARSGRAAGFSLASRTSNSSSIRSGSAAASTSGNSPPMAPSRASVRSAPSASRTASVVIAMDVAGWSTAARSIRIWAISWSSSRAASSPAWALGSPGVRVALTFATTRRAAGRLAASRGFGWAWTGAGAATARASSWKRRRAVREMGNARMVRSVAPSRVVMVTRGPPAPAALGGSRGRPDPPPRGDGPPAAQRMRAGPKRPFGGRDVVRDGGRGDRRAAERARVPPAQPLGRWQARGPAWRPGTRDIARDAGRPATSPAGPGTRDIARGASQRR